MQCSSYPVLSIVLYANLQATQQSRFSKPVKAARKMKTIFVTSFNQFKKARPRPTSPILYCTGASAGTNRGPPCAIAPPYLGP